MNCHNKIRRRIARDADKTYLERIKGNAGGLKQKMGGKRIGFPPIFPFW